MYPFLFSSDRRSPGDSDAVAVPKEHRRCARSHQYTGIGNSLGRFLHEGGSVFDLLGCKSVRGRMRELRKFIAFWYGPDRPEFAMSAPDSRLPLPLSLFYRHNARRKFSGHPSWRAEIFYRGAAGHHLLEPEELSYRRGRVTFFMERQGDWRGDTLQSEEEDPPVWLSGLLPTDQSLVRSVEGERQLRQSLSEFLVTHVLMASIHESENSRFRADGSHAPTLVDTFRRARSRKRILWDAGDPAEPGCPHYSGTIWLLHDAILVHETPSGDFTFGSNSAKIGPAVAK